MVVVVNKKIFLDKIIRYFRGDNNIPESLEDKISIWEELVTTESLENVPEDILSCEDKFLRLDLINRKLTDGEGLQTIDKTLDSSTKYGDKIALWNGDITTIYSDVIVNPTCNDMLLRREVKLENVDYNIFLRSGMRLVNKCLTLIDKELDDSEITITRAYNLPCDYIIHVIVPDLNEVNEEKLNMLSMCYMNALECAKNNMAKIIVIPCIGSDSNVAINRLVEVALESVYKFLDRNDSLIEKIILQVSNEEMYNLYSLYLTGDNDA